jgi:hypothetical protein
VENVFYQYLLQSQVESLYGGKQQKPCILPSRVAFRDRELASLQRDELQDLLDVKGKSGLSFSVVDHLRWDLKSIFDMAVAEGQRCTKPGTAAVHAERSEAAGSPRNDNSGGADMFWRSRFERAIDRKTRDTCRDASRRNLCPDVGKVSRNACRHPTTGLPEKDRHAEDGQLNQAGGII